MKNEIINILQKYHNNYNSNVNNICINDFEAMADEINVLITDMYIKTINNVTDRCARYWIDIINKESL